MSMHTKYLIIGNSAAGIGGVEGIRSVDPLGQILLVSDEKYHTYSRPLISYWVEDRVEPDKMLYRDENFYEDYSVQTKFDTKALSIDTEEKSVKLDTGETVEYDKLLIATGSHPFVPPIKGIESAVDATTFTKMDDAKTVLKVIERCESENREPRVVILGAGLIGLKAAEALYNKSESIVVLDLAERVMPSVFDENASEVMKSHLEEKGIELKLGTSIDKVNKNHLTLTNGEELDYDLLILAVGTRPAVELAEEAGIEVDRGIITDSSQLTSKKDVYAAGDCTKSHDISSDTDKNIAILPNAYLQGEAAGKNMAGERTVCEKLFPLNSMGLLGQYMLTAGSYEGNPIIVETEDSYREFFIVDNTLVGYIIIGTCQRGGIYTDLIRNKTDLSKVDLDALLEKPGIMPFDKSERIKKLSRAH